MEAIRYSAVVKGNNLKGILPAVAEKLAPARELMFRTAKNLIARHAHEQAKKIGACRPFEARKKLSLAKYRIPSVLPVEPSLSDVAKMIRQRFVYGDETPTETEVAVLAKLKQTNGIPPVLKYAATEALALIGLPGGEPTRQETEAINAEVVRRGREFLQKQQPPGILCQEVIASAEETQGRLPPREPNCQKPEQATDRVWVRHERSSKENERPTELATFETAG